MQGLAQKTWDLSWHPASRNFCTLSSLCSRATFLPHQTPTQKEEEPPNPAIERPFHSPSATRNMQLTYVARMLPQGRKGIYNSTWQPGIYLGKACCYVFPTPYICQNEVPSLYFTTPTWLVQEKSLSPVRNKGEDVNAGDLHRNPKLGTFSPRCQLG